MSAIEWLAVVPSSHVRMNQPFAGRPSDDLDRRIKASSHVSLLFPHAVRATDLNYALDLRDCIEVTIPKPMQFLLRSISVRDNRCFYASSFVDYHH